MHASLVIAHRFIRTTFAEKTLATMLALCALSTFMSIAAFMLMSAIMNGFQEATIHALQGIHHDVTFEAPDNAHLNAEKIHQTLMKEFPHLVAQTTAIASHYAIIQTETKHDISHVVLLQGIDPQTNALKPQHAPLQDALAHKNSMLGAALAEELGVKPGDMITLLFATENDDELRFEKAQLTIGDLFTTGIDDIDRTAAFCSLATFQGLLPDIGITQIGITLTPKTSPETAVITFKQRFPFVIYAWQELYPALLEGLAVERYALFLILLLVGFMTSINSIALLLMYITHHRKTIAIFFVMGMPLKHIRLIFTIINVTITLLATLAGIAVAAALSFLLETYQVIKLPAVYYTSHVPAHLEGSSALLVLVIMLVVSLATSWWATGRIRKMNIAEVLKKT